MRLPEGMGRLEPFKARPKVPPAAAGSQEAGMPESAEKHVPGAVSDCCKGLDEAKVGWLPEALQSCKSPNSGGIGYPVTQTKAFAPFSQVA